jgi:8-oxo-dGTP diphosphatase
MINATMCFLKNNRETLLLYRNRGEEDLHNGWYVPPGGRTERGERGIDCILREFREETGLTLINPKLRIIATFYNQGRSFAGAKENPDDWCVEVYEARKFQGELTEEHPKAKPIWIKDNDLVNRKIYPGDKKIMELLNQEGVFEVLTQYDKENLVRFESNRVS